MNPPPFNPNYTPLPSTPEAPFKPAVSPEKEATWIIHGGHVDIPMTINSTRTPGKLILFVWMIVAFVYLLVRIITRPDVMGYLTYWSFFLEIGVLAYMTAWEVAFLHDSRHAMKHPTRHHIPLYQRHWRSLVSLVGVYVGTSCMVFVGSVFISVDAAVSLAPLIASDSSLPLSNLVTHTLPLFTAVILLSAYEPEIRRNLAHARWVWFFKTSADTAAVFPEVRDGYEMERCRRRQLRDDGASNVGTESLRTRQSRARHKGDEIPRFDWRTVNDDDFAVWSKYPTLSGETDLAPQWAVDMGNRAFTLKLVRDVAHFWGPAVVPAIWTLTHTASGTYNITPTLAMYMLTVAALLGPSILLAIISRYTSVRDPVNQRLWCATRLRLLERRMAKGV